ncbi:hypothetical protein QE152_g38393 [Popillia japonica]|uniref:Uncharacterized protein n=1 Tax=Popillia japonica TaxID=7064 RepID=A0AAW1HY54_POPJA
MIKVLSNCPKFILIRYLTLHRILVQKVPTKTLYRMIHIKYTSIAQYDDDAKCREKKTNIVLLNQDAEY